MAQEHPFAKFIRIIGKGPRLSRPLTREETKEATTMILRREVDPVQLGAFLCILRVRTENPEEGAGFIDALRQEVLGKVTFKLPKVDLDWPSYAGKVRQLPYYMLAALCLSQNGMKIFMHGVSGHTNDRLYTDQTLAFLGIKQASSLEEAAQTLEQQNFCYLDLSHIHPVLKEIIDLKFTLGVRTPVNTFARMSNLLDAPYVVQCVTHLAYREIHRECAQLLGQKNMCVLKGEGGEFERRPQKPATVQSIRDGEMIEEEWEAFLDPEFSAHDEEMKIERLKEVWQGTDTHPYATSAVIGTMAVILRMSNKAENQEDAMKLAHSYWDTRNKGQLPYGK